MKKNIFSLIGNTPTVRLRGIERYFGVKSRLFAKLESFNPSGSVKDRAALWIIRDAISRGFAVGGGEVIEATSGNMGISLSMLSGIFGFRAVIFMPENMSEERVKLIKKYGGEVLLTPADERMMGAKDRAEKRAKNTKSSYTPCQFTNKMGVLAHFYGTGRELFSELGGKIDTLVCGIGTGATLMGTGGFLKKKLPSLKVIAVEPSESALLSGGSVGTHSIEGIGAGFFPPLLNMSMVDRIVAIPSEGAAEMADILARVEGLNEGISSGAALSAAILMAKENEKEENIAMIFPDSGDRYG